MPKKTFKVYNWKISCIIEKKLSLLFNINREDLVEGLEDLQNISSICYYLSELYHNEDNDKKNDIILPSIQKILTILLFEFSFFDELYHKIKLNNNNNNSIKKEEILTYLIFCPIYYKRINSIIIILNYLYNNEKDLLKELKKTIHKYLFFLISLSIEFSYYYNDFNTKYNEELNHINDELNQINDEETNYKTINDIFLKLLSYKSYKIILKDIINEDNNINKIEKDYYDENNNINEKNNKRIEIKLFYENLLYSLLNFYNQLYQDDNKLYEEIPLKLSDIGLLLNTNVWEVQYFTLLWLHNVIKNEHEELIQNQSLVTSSSVTSISTVQTSSIEEKSSNNVKNIRNLRRKSIAPPVKSNINLSASLTSTPTNSQKDQETIHRSTSANSINNQPNNINKKVRKLSSQFSITSSLINLGLLHNLFLLSFNHYYFIRYLIYKIISLVEITDSLSSRNELPLSLIEQGCLPLIEMISLGIPIYKVELKTNDNIINLDEKNNNLTVDIPYKDDLKDNTDDLFPEEIFRNQYKSLKNLIYNFYSKINLSSYISKGPLDLRVRIISTALILSSNCEKKSENILGNECLNNLVTPIPIQSSPLLNLIHNISKDFNEFSQLLEFLYQIIKISIDIHGNAQEKDEENEDEIDEENIDEENETDDNIISIEVDNDLTSISSASPFLTQEELLSYLYKKVSPIILVGSDKESSLKMVCPLMNVLEQNCYELSVLINKYHKKQIDESLKYWMNLSGDKNIKNDSTTLKKIELNIKEIQSKLSIQFFLFLSGDYDLWQEIFSHLSNITILNLKKIKIKNIKNFNLLIKLNLNRLIEAYTITKLLKFTQLNYIYEKLLIQKINSKNITKIFECSLTLNLLRFSYHLFEINSINFENYQLNIVNSNINFYQIKKIHLKLCCSCLYYLKKEIFLIIKKYNKENNNENNKEEDFNLLLYLLTILLQFLSN